MSEVSLIPVLLMLVSPGALAGGESVEGATPVRMAPVTPSITSGDPLIWRQEAAVLHGTEPGRIDLILDVKPGFTVYRELLEVEVLANPSGLHVGPADLPPGIVRLVPGRDEVAREQYDDDIVVHLPVSAPDGKPGLRTMHVRVQHQSCFAGHCFRPKEHIMAVHVPVRAPTTPAVVAPAPAPADAEALPADGPPASEAPTP